MGDKSWFYTVVEQLSAAANVHQRPELRDETHRACKLAMAEHDKEHAVIEAAKAYKHGWHNGQNMDVLRDALFEALQEVEGE